MHTYVYIIYTTKTCNLNNEKFTHEDYTAEDLVLQIMLRLLFICLYSKLTHDIAHQRMLTHLDAYPNKAA